MGASIRSPHPWICFNSQICPHWAWSNSSIQVQVFLPQHSSHSWVLAPGSGGSLCLSLQRLEKWFTLGPHFPGVSKKSCWCFRFFFSAFYLLIAGSGDFQAPYMLDQRLELTGVCFDWLTFIIMGYILCFFYLSQKVWYHRIFTNCGPPSGNSWCIYFARFSSYVQWEGNSGPSLMAISVLNHLKRC